MLFLLLMGCWISQEELKEWSESSPTDSEMNVGGNDADTGTSDLTEGYSCNDAGNGICFEFFDYDEDGFLNPDNGLSVEVYCELLGYEYQENNCSVASSVAQCTYSVLDPSDTDTTLLIQVSFYEPSFGNVVDAENYCSENFAVVEESGCQCEGG